MKNIIRLSLCILFITCFSFGENISINDISVRFCNENDDAVQKRVSLYSEAGKETKECIIIINNSENNGYIDLHFVSQTKTNQWEKACALPGNPDDIFVKYLKPNRSGLIYVWANTTIKQYFVIDFPVWIAGVKWWCLAFLTSNNENTKSKWNLLSMIARKANLFDILLDDNLNFIDNIKLTKLNKSSWRILVFWNRLRSWISRDSKNKTVWINIGAKNLWNVSHSISFSGKLYGLLWYKKNVISEKWILRYDNLDWTIVSKTWLSLPEYQWFFWLHLNVRNSLHFDFDTSHIPKDKLTEKHEKYTIVFFVLSRISIWFWLIVILSIFMIYHIWKKKWGFDIDNLINRNFESLKKMFTKK